MKHFLNLMLAATATLCACQQVELDENSLTGGLPQAEAVSDDDATKSYTASDLALTSDWVRNPEKGLYKHYEIYFDLQMHLNHPDWALNSDGISDLDSGSYNFASYTDGTLVLTLFYLVDYRTKNLDSKALNAIEKTFQKVRAAGKKAIVRIAYSHTAGSDATYDSGQPRDASLSQIQAHLNQMSSILDNYKDVIYLVQAGCIGTYGEWYYISRSEFNYSYDGSSRSGFSGRKDVITALLNAVPGRQVGLRTPNFKRFYLNKKSDYQYPLNSYATLSRPNAEGDAHYRLAFFNDVFMCDKYDEMGTFGRYSSDPEISFNKQMWKDQAAFLAVGGETANNGSTQPYMKDVNTYDPVSYIKQYHMSYLHQRTNSDMYTYWQGQGKEKDIKNALGYRLWLTNFKISGTVSAGKTVNMIFSIKNNGAAPVIYKRPMKIVFIRNSDKKVTELASTTGSVSNYIFFSQGNTQTTQHGSTDYADIRQVAPNQYKYFTCQVTLPSNISSGDMIAIWMPDQASNLRNRKEYSIRLCNKQQGGFKWQDYADRDNTMAGFNTVYTF